MSKNYRESRKLNKDNYKKVGVNGKLYVDYEDRVFATTESNYCNWLKCQRACDHYYSVVDNIAPLAMCMSNKNYCQCSRKMETLMIKCSTMNCNINCISSGYDFGMCNDKASECFCFNALNHFYEKAKSRWEKEIEYWVVFGDTKVRVLTKNGNAHKMSFQ